MRPAPREPSKQLNAKSLPVTKRRAASGVRLSAQAEPAASKIKTTIANRVTIPDPLPLRPAIATCCSTNCPSGIAIFRPRKSAAAEGNSARLRYPAPVAWPRTAAARSDAQCEQFNYADPDHQHGECYRIIVEPISPLVHGTPPCPRFISRAGRTRYNILNKGLTSTLIISVVGHQPRRIAPGSVQKLPR